MQNLSTRWHCFITVHTSFQHHLHLELELNWLVQNVIELEFELSRSEICGKYFLSFPQKTFWPEKTDIAKCLLFNFWVIKSSKKPFYHLAIWQNWCFGQFYHSKIEFKHLSISVFPGQRFFLREWEEIFSKYFGPQPPDTVNKAKHSCCLWCRQKLNLVVMQPLQHLKGYESGVEEPWRVKRFFNLVRERVCELFPDKSAFWFLEKTATQNSR